MISNIIRRICYSLGFGIIILFVVTSCKSLNSHVSLTQLEARSSLDMQSIFSNPESSSCELGFNFDFDDKMLKNNLWGKNKLKNGVPELCIYRNKDHFAWKWKIPTNAKGVIGYPAIQIGQSPFWNIKKEKYGFPVNVSKIAQLSIDYDFETYVKHNKFNLAFDLWLTDVQYSTKENIKVEIMIWEDYFDFKSYGKKLETIITPFGVYKVRAGYLKNPKYAQDWKYIAFVRQQTRSRGTVDVNHFLNYLIDKNMISKDYFLSCLELGNEIGNSSGMTLVKRFEYIFQKVE